MSGGTTSNVTTPDVLGFFGDQAARDALADTLLFEQVIIEDFEAAYCLGATGAIWRGADTLIDRILAQGIPVAVTTGKNLDLAPGGSGSGLLIVSGDGMSPLMTASAPHQIIVEIEQSK